MPQLTPVSKIKLIDGTVVDLAHVNQIVIPDGSEYNVNWNISNFTGSVALITGTTEDYRLNINEQRS